MTRVQATVLNLVQWIAAIAAVVSGITAVGAVVAAPTDWWRFAVAVAVSVAAFVTVFTVDRVRRTMRDVPTRTG